MNVCRLHNHMAETVNGLKDINLYRGPFQTHLAAYPVAQQVPLQ